MNFKEAIVSCFTKYAIFKGRASRSEYWYWSLFCFLVFLPLAILKLHALDTILTFAFALPWIAVTTRRLHDVNRSGWWQLIPITIIGIIPFIYWMCKAPVNIGNRFGPTPVK